MARQFRVGETVKFASCGPDYSKRSCDRCRSCIAQAWQMLDKEKKGGCKQYVHGIIISTDKKVKHRGTVCVVQIRQDAPKPMKKGEDTSTSVDVPNWLLRPSTKVIAFKDTSTKQVEKHEAFNPFSLL